MSSYMHVDMSSFDLLMPIHTYTMSLVDAHVTSTGTVPKIIGAH